MARKNKESQGDVPFAKNSLLDIALKVKDPAKWAAVQMLRPMPVGTTCGQAMDAIEATICEAFEQYEKNRIVRCPGCRAVLFDQAAVDGICGDCQKIFKASKRLNKICPDCGSLAPHGGVHNKPDGAMCPMMYGRRGWRTLGEYDT